MNLSEQDIANDILCMSKHGIDDVTKAGLECMNIRLRETLRQDRNRAEQAHDEISNIAISNNWYLPASPAEHSDVSRVSHFLSQGATGFHEADFRQPTELRQPGANVGGGYGVPPRGTGPYGTHGVGGYGVSPGGVGSYGTHGVGGGYGTPGAGVGGGYASGPVEQHHGSSFGNPRGYTNPSWAGGTRTGNYGSTHYGSSGHGWQGPPDWRRS